MGSGHFSAILLGYRLLGVYHSRSHGKRHYSLSSSICHSNTTVTSTKHACQRTSDVNERFDYCIFSFV